MSVHNQVLEQAWSDRWCLAGSVTSSAHVISSSHSLKLIRRLDAVSPFIRSAMNAGSLIPEIEINTPDGRITLKNATIVSIASPTTIGRERGGGWGVEDQGFPVPKDTTNRFEEMVFNFTFATIAISHKKNKGITDNWSSGG